MSDATVIQLVATITTAFVSIAAAYFGAKYGTKQGTAALEPKIDKIAIEVDGKMAALLEAVQQKSLAEGHILGIAAEQQRSRELYAATAPTKGPAPTKKPKE